MCVTDLGRSLGMRHSFGILRDDSSSAEEVARGLRFIVLPWKSDSSVAVVVALEECIGTVTSGLHKSNCSLDRCSLEIFCANTHEILPLGNLTEDRIVREGSQVPRQGHARRIH
jgi:hypothetical protein